MMNLTSLNAFVSHLSQYDTLLSLLRAFVYLIVGFILARLVSSTLVHIYEKRTRAKYSLLIRKISFYIIFVLFAISAIRELGFDLRVLLGATGILTVALGFASQTSASNFISGLFLLGERAFHVGDTISLNGITGEVFSVDLFSVKLKQNDNTLARIPNEVIIKTQIINLTHFPQRRYDSTFTVPANTDINLLRKALFSNINTDPLCLNAPAPSLEIKELTNSGIVLLLHVWSTQKNFTAMKYSVQEKLLQTVRDQQIDFADNTHQIRLLKEPLNDNSQNNNLS